MDHFKQVSFDCQNRQFLLEDSVPKVLDKGLRKNVEVLLVIVEDVFDQFEKSIGFFEAELILRQKSDNLEHLWLEYLLKTDT